jgi:3-hydroxyacyl-[acyl-carrier-protein] dehydratase
MPPSLLHTFYKELNSTFSKENEQNFSSTVEINAGHPIFHGHFKQVPITPGVCIIQMIKEIVSEKLKLELFLEEGDNIKFLAMVNPLETPKLTIQFQLTFVDIGLVCVAACSTDASVCVKFKGKFKMIETGNSY